MTELETHLLKLVQNIEEAQEDRAKQFAATLSSLTTRLTTFATQVTALSAHVNDLTRRIEHLHAILTRR